jgi:hypothetical protein
MKRDGELWRRSRLRQCKYVNNIVEQDHRGQAVTEDCLKPDRINFRGLNGV